jgi:hypothetical protein
MPARPGKYHLDARGEKGSVVSTSCGTKMEEGIMASRISPALNPYWNWPLGPKLHAMQPENTNLKQLTGARDGGFSEGRNEKRTLSTLTTLFVTV